MGKATIIEAQNSTTIYEEGSTKGILGKLKGVFADYKNGTRNAGRLYGEELWDKRVFGSEDVMEALETKTLFGELDHPEGDRCETLAKNAAITITKLEKRPEEGVIYGEAEILDTPTGRIVKALADSGAKLGISSRGMGEEIYYEGQNIIDPETYDFITFDVVVTPANTKARVALTESKHLDKLTESLKKEIEESETENQLNQMKVVLESVSLNDKSELLGLVESKLSNLSAKEIDTVKLEEANKTIALNLLNKKFNETITLLNESTECSASLASENKVLAESNDFLKESRNTLKSKLKEANESIKELTTKLEESQEANKTLIAENKQTLEKVKTVNEKKVEHINKLHEAEKAKILEAKNSLEQKYAKLEEANKVLSKNLEASSKILSENKELKNTIAKLEEANKVNVSKLTESKLQESKQIKELRAKIQELEEKNVNLNEAKDRFAKLDFNPIGTVKAVAENFSSDNYTDEDIQLYNALTGK